MKTFGVRKQKNPKTNQSNNWDGLAQTRGGLEWRWVPLIPAWFHFIIGLVLISNTLMLIPQFHLKFYLSSRCTDVIGRQRNKGKSLVKRCTVSGNVTARRVSDRWATKGMRKLSVCVAGNGHQNSLLMAVWQTGCVAALQRATTTLSELTAKIVEFKSNGLGSQENQHYVTILTTT